MIIKRAIAQLISENNKIQLGMILSVKYKFVIKNLFNLAIIKLFNVLRKFISDPKFLHKLDNDKTTKYDIFIGWKLID